MLVVESHALHCVDLVSLLLLADIDHTVAPLADLRMESIAVLEAVALRALVGVERGDVLDGDAAREVAINTLLQICIRIF